MEAALALIVRHSGGHLSDIELRYLLRMGYSSLLVRTGCGGYIFRALCPKLRLEVP
jgi:hypothetical protein